jgi:hypothetical protein
MYEKRIFLACVRQAWPPDCRAAPRRGGSCTVTRNARAVAARKYIVNDQLLCTIP